MLLLGRYPEFFSLSFNHDCAGDGNTFHQERRLSVLVSVSRGIHVGHIFGIVGEGQLVNVSVGLESCRTSSFSSQVTQTCSTALAFWVQAMAC